MRRAVGFSLVAAGVLLLVLAPLLRWFVWPRVAVTPLDQFAIAVSTGTDLTVFDAGTLSERTTDLTSTRRVIADVDASTSDVAVWDTFVNTADDSGTTINAYTERAAFDRHSSAPVAGYDENFNDEAVEHQGFVFKFPFGTEKREYDFWDNTLFEAFPATYTGTDEIDGLSVYTFEQEVPPTVVMQMEVPGSLVGRPEEQTVTADRVYANTRTLWVEPQTGVIIKGQEEPRTVLRYLGQEEVTLTDGTLAYDDATVADRVDEYSGLATQLRIVRTTGPIALVVLGVALLLVGAFLLLRDRRERARHAPGTAGGDRRGAHDDTVTDDSLSVMRPDDGR